MGRGIHNGRGRREQGVRAQGDRGQQGDGPAVLAEAERSLEMGERKQRSREYAKACALFEASRSALAAAGLGSDRAGCLIFAAASTALLDAEQDAARVAAFGSRPDPAARGAALQRRRALLDDVGRALAAGWAAAAAGGAKADELSHLAESAGTVQLLLSEAHEELGDGPSALACAARAVASLEDSLRLHQAATDAAAAAAREPVAAEPSIELLRALAPALMAFGKLALQAAGAAPDGRDPAALRAQGEHAVERSLQLLQEACALCDSERGDDLPNAVEEWARLLWEASALAPPGGGARVLECAAAKVRESLGLVRIPLASTGVLLGDILRAAAEEAAAPLPAAGLEPLRAASRLYGAALAEGYGRALAVSGSDVAAQLGAADACLDCARLLRKLPLELLGALRAEGHAASLTEDPSGCLDAALRGYAALGARPLADWAAAGLSAEEHGDFRFNWACAAALRGAEEAARGLLSALVAEGRVGSDAELSADEDLRPYLQSGWMQALRRALSERG